MAGTLFNRVQAFFEVVHFGVELAIDAFGLGIQLVLFLNLVFQFNDRGDTAFAQPNLTLQDQQQGDQSSWQKAVVHKH